ncbi:MAG: GNAT family N-acetyltransferase [Synergistes sp.]|nr:GNAT family N-acetyltransferase [Synergistes sp.]
MDIRFETVAKSEFGAFRRDVMDIFAIAVTEKFGDAAGQDVISEEDVNKSLLSPCAEVYYIYLDGEKIGGVSVSIKAATQRNSLDLFYIYPSCQNRGYGQLVWRSIEAKYPQTLVWELITPYFEKRNINFYVNKCGFHITEFFNKHHKDTSEDAADAEFREEYFRFEKIMPVNTS